MTAPFRILLLVDCFYPVTKSAPKMIHDLAAEFLAQGHEPSILAPSEFVDRSVSFETLDGIEVIRVKYPRLKGALRIFRGIGELVLSPLLWWKTRQLLATRRYDLIVFYSPTIFLGPYVGRLKRLWRCPAYLILRDIWPQFLVDTGVLSKGPLLKLFEHYEKLQNEAADFIGVQTPGDLHHLGQKPNVEVLNNWIAINNPEADPEFRKARGLEGKVIFLYGGNFGIAQDLGNILRLAESLREYPEAVFVLLGTGTEEDTLRQYVLERGLKNVLFLPPVPQGQFDSIVAAADVCLISLHPDFSIQNIPGKLLSYFNCSKPVLCSVNAGSDLFNLISEAGAGFCDSNGEDSALAKHALELLKSYDLRVACGRSGRAYLERQFSVKAAATQILSHFGVLRATSPMDSVSTT